jgi:hypothetical protein
MVEGSHLMGVGLWSELLAELFGADDGGGGMPGRRAVEGRQAGAAGGPRVIIRGLGRKACLQTPCELIGAHADMGMAGAGLQLISGAASGNAQAWMWPFQVYSDRVYHLGKSIE